MGEVVNCCRAADVEKVLRLKHSKWWLQVPSATLGRALGSFWLEILPAALHIWPCLYNLDECTSNNLLSSCFSILLYVVEDCDVHPRSLWVSPLESVACTLYLLYLQWAITPAKAFSLILLQLGTLRLVGGFKVLQVYCHGADRLCWFMLCPWKLMLQIA